ncbi:hypothetical protein HPB50_010243 [Hyalomma asiaticum]|uniref:Uncharacterized protein n=1 Tax=Hyalomma asiaticum TaxID=266040 RepID=A0ACB7SG13_HYAAI|nr:hypothetical protein HPB50_010243 [Hyalomma asiaticum]
MPVHEQEAKYAAISAQYGAPAYCSSQDLSTATCFNCRQLGYLAARCPAPRDTRQRLPDNSHPHTAAMSCLDGSLIQCAVIEAHVAGVGLVDAFPDSGSKGTILTEDLVPPSALSPWTKPPISVVGGGTVMPSGTMTTYISVGPISAVVDVTVLPHNLLPPILREDWFQAAQAELVVKPPKPMELHHPSTNTVLFCHEKVFPRMSNAVFLHSQPLLMSPHFITGGLQLEPLPDNNQPPWLSLAYLCFLLLTTFLYIMNFQICLHPQGCPMPTCREIKEWEQLNRSLTTLETSPAVSTPEEQTTPEATTTAETTTEPTTEMTTTQLPEETTLEETTSTETTPETTTEVTTTAETTSETTEAATTSFETRLLDLIERSAEAQDNAIRAQQRKRHYDESHRDAKFHVGQYVWLQRQEPITDGTLCGYTADFCALKRWDVK